MLIWITKIRYYDDIQNEMFLTYLAMNEVTFSIAPFYESTRTVDVDSDP